MSVLHLDDSSFDKEVLHASEPVLVDFFAEWCGPCKMIAPIFEEVAAQYVGKCKLVKVNVDDASRTAAKFSVMSIPTLIIFKNGEKKATTMGAMSKAELIAFIDMNI